MRWTDERIADAIARLDPARDLTDDKIDTERAWAAISAKIAQGAPAPTPVRARRRVLVPAIAFAVAVVVAMTATVIGFQTTPAAALGPAPLPFTPVEATVADVVTDAEDRQTHDGSGVAAAEREARTVGWYAEIRASSGEDELHAIQPEVRDLVWAEDLSGRLTVTAGIPYLPDGTPAPNPAPAPGSLVYEMTFASGEFTTRDASVPSADVDQLAATLDLLSNCESTRGAADHAYGVTALLNTWTVPDDVHAAMLEVLERDGDAEVVGTTIDRAGRPAIGLRARSQTSPWFDVIVLVSTESGRIIGVEEVYTGLKDELPIPAGTVIGYTLWETTS